MKTSIAYQVSNIVLRNEIYYNWQEFISILNQGPEKMKAQLFNLWEKTKQKLINNKDIEVLDINKKITEQDFEITSNVTDKNIRMFYFIFPDSDEAMAQCKCVALVFTDKAPRYFTMEYFSKENNEDSFVFGEWVLNLESNSFSHRNYGKLANPTVDNFSSRVQEKIEEI